MSDRFQGKRRNHTKAGLSRVATNVAVERCNLSRTSDNPIIRIGRIFRSTYQGNHRESRLTGTNNISRVASHSLTINRNLLRHRREDPIHRIRNMSTTFHHRFTDRNFRLKPTPNSRPSFVRSFLIRRFHVFPTRPKQDTNSSNCFRGAPS